MANGNLFANVTQRIKYFNDFFSNIGFVVRLGWTEGKDLLLSLMVLRIVRSLLPVVNVYIAKLVIDELAFFVQSGIGAHLTAVWWYLGAGFLAQVTNAVLANWSSINERALSLRFRFAVERVTMEQATRLDVGHFENETMHDKIERVLYESVWRASSIVDALFNLGGEFISLLSFVVVLHTLGWLFIGLLLAATVPGFLLQFLEGKRKYEWRAHWTNWFRRAHYYRHIVMHPDFTKDLRLFRLSELFIGRFTEGGSSYLHEEHRFDIQLQKIALPKHLLPHLGNIVGFIVVVSRVSGRTLTLGDIALFEGGYRSAQGSFGSIIAAIGELYENHLFIRDLREFLAFQPAITTKLGSRVIGRNESLEIEFRDVSFWYVSADTPILSHVSFVLAPGSHTALVGENGAGKTTIVNLLLRFYDPTEGQILVNGTDLRNVDLASYRERVTGILQESIRFHTTIKEHIGYGEIGQLGDMARIQHAAHSGRAHQFITNLPNGYETVAGDWELDAETHKLSGGQWQRLALSRACMNTHAGLVILDEPTSSVDAEGEEQFFENMMNLNHEIAMLFISHRFSTVRRASRIIVLDAGRIIEDGSHEQLMVANGRYADLFRTQAEWYQ